MEKGNYLIYEIKEQILFLLIVLLLLLVSCDVTNVPNKITSKTDYNLSREIVLKNTY